ncbi:YceI family protein [Pedobacter sp. Du54]|uniref:YceI family protein n=1 Tax=Pedobacter anseongensis TaxID=3133439 RepID=UPI0030B5208B
MKTALHNLRICTVLKIAVLSIALSPIGLMAQPVYKLTPANDVFVKVYGTSNVHDWTMTSTGIESQGVFKFNSKDELIGLSAFTFTVQARSLKSGKSSMDDRTYKSILADAFPKIVYQLKTATVNPLGSNRFQLQTTGSLTIAGATQLITLNVMATLNPDQSITCTGTEKLKLTDYKIDPPSFMLGAMKVGNDLTIKFDLNYNKAVNAK